MPASATTLRRRKQVMPSFVRHALDETGLMPAYQARPRYQQNDYLGWIADGKQEETRERRLNQMLTELKHGKLYMNMSWTPRTRRSVGLSGDSSP